MCGITGFIDYTNQSSEVLLCKMRDSLYHRGPDSMGAVFINNSDCQIGFGHRRLSIIDLSECGNQPMRDESDNYIITFNGEVYNYKEIKSELQSLGIQFYSASDTEVVLKAYIQWGIRAVDKFIGMFAFAIYDRLKNKVYFCRDRAGVKPFYYYFDSKVILFGSELKSLIQHPSFQKRINFDSLGNFLKRGWIASPFTIFESTYKLKPGHYLEVALDNQGISEKCYWDVHDYYRMDELPVSFNEAKERIHELLKSACEYRMVADTEVGVFLSGGFDSSLVTAILQKERKNKLNTFSIGFEEKRYNEAPYAKAVANHLGTNHHEFICSAQDALKLIPDLPYFYDEPFADSSALPTMLVSKLASSKVKVCLSADGGDEVFGGYTRYFANDDIFDMIKNIPKFMRGPLSGLMGLFTVYSAKNPRAQIRLEKLQKGLKVNEFAHRFRFRSEPMHFSIHEINKVIKRNKIDLGVKTFYDDIRLRKGITPTMYMMALEYKTSLIDDMLVKVDRATMAYSIEGREPLLDHRLVEYCARLSKTIHYKNYNSKSLIREICYEYIPRQLMDRPKKGFSIPTERWLRNELKELVMDYSQHQFLKDQNIFSIKSYNKIVDGFFKGGDKNAERIWILLMFQLWYKKWMLS